MTKTPCFRALPNSGSKQVYSQQITFQYDCANDTECNISDELLKEDTTEKESKLMQITNIKIHSSPFDSKISKKLPKSTLSKSIDGKCMKVERNTIDMTIINKNQNSSYLAVRDSLKSSDLEITSSSQNRSKSKNMKEEITGLLKLLVIERKKQENLERTVKSMSQKNKEDFISVKDLRCLYGAQQVQ